MTITSTASGQGDSRRPPAGEGAGLSILVVDDNEDAAEMLAEVLALVGHRTRAVFDSAGALELAEGFRPDAALLDIGLPGMDGYELARRLRAIPELARICLVAVTGYGQASDRERALQAGFDEHLVKPVDFDEVQAVLSRLCTCG
jgi:CheY-like chemotaxis protein